MFKKKITISWIVQVSMLSALAVILYNFPKFPLPFLPSNLKVQFSMLPTIIGGYALGPIGGVIICLIKFLFKLLTTQSAGIGEIVDLIIGLCVVLVTSIIYYYNRTKKGAILGLIIGSIVWIIVSVFLNGVWAMPAFVKIMGLEDTIKKINFGPTMTEDNFMQVYLLLGCLPYNIMMSTVVSIVTYFVYKRISWLFNKMDNKMSKKK